VGSHPVEHDFAINKNSGDSASVFNQKLKHFSVYQIPLALPWQTLQSTLVVSVSGFCNNISNTGVLYSKHHPS